MKSVKKSLAKWLKRNFCSEQEVYLGSAVDRADFEYRLKTFENTLQYPSYKYLPIYFV